MWSVSAPEVSQARVIEQCCSIPDRRQALVRESAREILAASEAYVSAAKMAQMHTLNAGDFVLKDISVDDMRWLYENRLYRGPGRAIYEAIKCAPKHRVCPMCGVREVRDLDHVLPKGKFAALTIDPNNLVPVCAECNNLKGEHSPSSATEQFLHPYFENIEGSRWLHSTIQEDKEVAAFTFRVQAGPDWSPELSARVRWQFDKFKLGRLYASHAGRELARIRGSLAKIYDRQGAEGVRFRLKEDAESRLTAELNSWNSAMYEAMADCVWFCGGGFKFTG